MVFSIMTSHDECLRVLRLRVTPGSPFTSCMGIKAHQRIAASTETKQSDTLFCVGIPLSFDEFAMKSVFTCFGDVLNVVMHANKRSGMVVFEDSMSVTLALKAADEQLVVEWRVPESDGPIGLKAWVQNYKALRPGNNILQRQLDEWVASFEAEEDRREKQKKASMAEDGWTVVVRSKGRAKETDEGGMSIKSGGVAKAAAIESKKKALAKTGDTGFYRFHQRDKRRSELLTLKQQFEQDKKKIAELRQSRIFKPY